MTAQRNGDEDATQDGWGYRLDRICYQDIRQRAITDSSAKLTAMVRADNGSVYEIGFDRDLPDKRLNGRLKQ
ncbi:hypothetical protein ANCDUO_24496 [Ancylostoma duodenale]|uniref:Uncharacterized protein n=1 Tax=Ancylostoma duodenale TaxID=51022 RepID=A0A0C2BNR2_9BILA|nr:hypothetical protein ANCDUO_24496 [Ancylostoma duodenale]